MKYAQVIKHRKNGRLVKVEKRVIFVKDVDEKQISTSLIERQNLTFRQHVNRISRKTLGFSKKLKDLDEHMTLYFAHFNFCREHSSLTYRDEKGILSRNSPAKEYGLINTNMKFKKLLTYPYHRTSTN